MSFIYIDCFLLAQYPDWIANALPSIRIFDCKYNHSPYTEQISICPFQSILEKSFDLCIQILYNCFGMGFLLINISITIFEYANRNFGSDIQKTGRIFILFCGFLTERRGFWQCSAA